MQLNDLVPPAKNSKVRKSKNAKNVFFFHPKMYFLVFFHPKVLPSIDYCENNARNVMFPKRFISTKKSSCLDFKRHFSSTFCAKQNQEQMVLKFNLLLKAFYDPTLPFFLSRRCIFLSNQSALRLQMNHFAYSMIHR